MQNTSSRISTIHTSRATLTDLMARQGYDVSDYSNMSLTDTNARHESGQLDMLFDKSASATQQIHKTYVNYHLDKALRPAYIQTIIDDLFHVEEVLQKSDTLMFVTKDETSENVLNSIRHTLEKDGIFVIVQNIKRLQFNIMDHSLFPPHHIMNDAKVKEVMLKHNLHSISEFPNISRFDPAAVVIGMRPGQVCEIDRPSKLAITGKYYRACI